MTFDWTHGWDGWARYSGVFLAMAVTWFSLLIVSGFLNWVRGRARPVPGPADQSSPNRIEEHAPIFSTRYHGAATFGFGLVIVLFMFIPAAMAGSKLLTILGFALVIVALVYLRRKRDLDWQA